MKLQYYICETCGNIVTPVHNSGVPIVCCGKPMRILTANTTDAAVEKHVPVYTVDGQTVRVFVGSVEHPMAQEHHIGWIALETNHGHHYKVLHPGQAPEVFFALSEGEKLEAVYAWCNLHGLWKA